jgi:hypothetical protein
MVVLSVGNIPREVNMKRKKFLDMLSLESASVNPEKEAVLYALIGDYAGLSLADAVEEHYQLEGKFDGGPKCRVRRTTSSAGDVKYEFTIKIYNDESNISACTEHSSEVDENFFNNFKLVSSAEYQKSRFTYNSTSVELSVSVNGDLRKIQLPNLKYEVDVYKDIDGRHIDWCKIDVELDDILTHIPEYTDVPIKLIVKVSHLPFKPTNTRLGDTDDQETNDFIDAIWHKFNIKK